MSLSGLSDELSQVRTKKKEFLSQIERIVPWGEWIELIRPHYYKGERGNKPYDLERMLRIYLVQNLYDLSDKATVAEVIDSRAFSEFCGVESSNQVPDGDTLGRFRNLLLRSGLQEKLFAQVVYLLQERGLLLKKGTIVDSTLIAAPSSTKNREKKRDPDRRAERGFLRCCQKYYHVRLDLKRRYAFPLPERRKPQPRQSSLTLPLCSGKRTAFSVTPRKQTLDLAQSQKRLFTYPRTDSSFLTDDMGGTAADIIALLCEKLPFMAGADFTPEIAKVLDSKKVSDHHAIIPTMELAKADPDALPESEKNILTLAGARLLFATAEPHIYEAVTAVFSCAGTDFTARGKTVLAEGWKELERRYRATLKDKPEAEDGENEGVTLPELSEGQNFPNPAAKVTEHTTTPPKPHSEASLLSAMERAGNGDTDPDAERRGLGTPATRAAVIEKLVKGGFAERKGKQLIPTQNGAALISVLPDMLTSPQLTAEWENNLTQIAKGAADPGEFLSGIEAMARELVQTHAAALDGKKDLFREEKPSVGKCPRCGSPVHEGKKNYYCSNKECAFVMWKNDRFFEERKTAFSAKIAAALLKSGKVNVKKLYSPKTGKTYDGTIVLADTGGKYVNYRIEVQKN